MRDRRRESGEQVRVQNALPVFDRPLPRSSRYLITSAQNATPVHKKFLRVLERAAADLQAELVVVPIRYKNPTSIWSSKQKSDDWWAPELEPYLFNKRARIGKNLVLAADVATQPTASEPLTGFEALTGKESCIIAHPKMQFRAVASPAGKTPKILSTTGSVTVKNFTPTKAGKLGAFHHYLGAVIVELDGPLFHLRQINAHRETGEFIDLNRLHTSAGVQKAPPAAAISFGDVHARFACPRVDEATHGPGGIVATLDPEVLLWNDLHDGYAINPHHGDDPFIAIAKRSSGTGNVRAEVEHAVRFVADRTGGRRSVIVPSNHDNFLKRWIVSGDWKRQPINAEFYLETALAMLRSTQMTDEGTDYADPFIYWVDRLKGKANITALQPGESFTVKGIEHGLHGDKGPNGARGNLKNLARIGTRVTSGHSHTPGIHEGHYQAGTSTKLRLEYTKGSPSSWLNTHVVTYASGARALITVVDGRWKA